jgi:YVTN family beta-propeller protein
VTPNGASVYVTNQASGTVSVINTATNTVTANIPTSGSCPFGIVISRLNFGEVGPTAAGVTVSGKVTTAQGRGIRNVMITMTDANGNERMTQTTAFGHYRFDDVSAGETVTLSAKARRFKFNQSSIVRTTNDSIADADFVGVY